MKVAIITGASHGIGAGLVAGFRAAGYAVVGTARSIEPVDDVNLITVPGDITDPVTARSVADHALERFGQIDTLVNNAGVYIGKDFADYTIADYNAVASVNLVGFLHMTQAVIRPMIAQRHGHIVNITTSLVEHANSSTHSALASLTKGGLAAVTRSLAMEYAAAGIRVNALSLGIIRTPMHDPASYADMAALHPLGRLGEIEDVLDGILYLERAGFVTGESLHIDGGQAAGR